MKIYYSVWREPTGAEVQPVFIVGSIQGKDFKDACVRYFGRFEEFDAENLTWAGCKLFYNAKGEII